MLLCTPVKQTKLLEIAEDYREQGYEMCANYKDDFGYDDCFGLREAIVLDKADIAPDIANMLLDYALLKGADSQVRLKERGCNLSKIPELTRKVADLAELKENRYFTIVGYAGNLCDGSISFEEIAKHDAKFLIESGFGISDLNRAYLTLDMVATYPLDMSGQRINYFFKECKMDGNTVTYYKETDRTRSNWDICYLYKYEISPKRVLWYTKLEREGVKIGSSTIIMLERMIQQGKITDKEIEQQAAKLSEAWIKSGEHYIGNLHGWITHPEHYESWNNVIIRHPRGDPFNEKK